MICTTPPSSSTTTTQCVPCKHPFDYLFELAYVGTTAKYSKTTFDESIDRLTDKGLNFLNCGLCCPDCSGIYAFASVETMLKLYEFLGITTTPIALSPELNTPLGAVDPQDFPTCCSNIYASTDTWLRYAEMLGMLEQASVPALNYGVEIEVPNNEFLTKCCNGFDECVDDLICWFTTNSNTPDKDIDRLNDKGIVEYGQIQNNCTGATSTSICKLIELLEKYSGVKLSGTRYDFIDRLLDKGIVVSCSSNGEIHIGSVETWKKYAEAVGIGMNIPVPALSNTTTTTTVA